MVVCFRRFLPVLICSFLFFLPLNSFADDVEREENYTCDTSGDGWVFWNGWECINDSVSLISSKLRADADGWQYAVDNSSDGVESGRVGGDNDFEIYGLAFRNLGDEFWFVFNTNVTPEDPSHIKDKNKNPITYGDLFLNIGNGDFKSTSDANGLFAFRFVSNNDSGVSSVGVYKNVNAKSVTGINKGFATLAKYEKHVTNKKGTFDYADLPFDQNYYAQNISYNVINSGDFLGDLTVVTPAELHEAGYVPPTGFSGSKHLGFKIKKSLIIDACGIIGGDGTSCLDCAGEPCGEATVDVCNVCNGDGTSCLDCEGTPFGEVEVDHCGVCGGDGSSCLDCRGEPNGTAKVDECGVCEGDGTSCADCAGVPNGDAVVDECGVCEGDNTSCLECVETDYTETILSLDGGSVQQMNQVTRALNLLKNKGKNTKNNRKFIRNIRSQAHKLHMANWTNSWTFSPIMKQCANQALCVSVSNTATIDAYGNNAGELFGLSKKVVRRIRKITGFKRRGHRILRGSRATYRDVMKDLSAMPESTSACVSD